MLSITSPTTFKVQTYCAVHPTSHDGAREARQKQAEGGSWRYLRLALAVQLLHPAKWHTMACPSVHLVDHCHLRGQPLLRKTQHIPAGMREKAHLRSKFSKTDSVEDEEDDFNVTDFAPRQSRKQNQKNVRLRKKERPGICLRDIKRERISAQHGSRR